MTVQRRRSPRERRLNSDLRAMQQLVRESSIVSFEAHGELPEHYRVRFDGRGLWKPDESADVLLRRIHEVTITLTSAYPRMIPELAWQTPMFHPNISASGVVCLGGYGTHWVPSLMLDELCHMLWDMIRYKNFDIESPYNREAAVWTKQQTHFTFPVDERPLRNQVGLLDKVEDTNGVAAESGSGIPNATFSKAIPVGPNPVGQSNEQPDVQFLDATPQSADAATGNDGGDNDIMFIE